MGGWEWCFWILVGVVLYPYAIYPGLLLLAGKWRKRRVRSGKVEVRGFSLILAVRNEEKALERRLRELIDHVQGAEQAGEIIVVSDGSDDGTVELARRFESEQVRVVAVPEGRGKAAAVSLGARLATHEILAFADVRQTWAVDALEHLLANFADPTVGAVSGELHLTDGAGVLAGVGLYWRWEKWLRRQESALYSLIGVTGAISAVRRRLFQEIPSGTILDDVYWPLQVVKQGYRVVHEDRAHAFDRLPDRAHDEFRRKVRTLAGNFQLLALLPETLLPWSNPVWLQLLSHKVARLVVPWALIAILLLSALLPGPVYSCLFVVQVLGYLMAAWAAGTGSSRRLFAAAGSFLVLNAAAWVAFWVWASGRSGRSWQPVAYRPQPRLLPVVESARLIDTDKTF